MDSRRACAQRPPSRASQKSEETRNEIFHSARSLFTPVPHALAAGTSLKKICHAGAMLQSQTQSLPALSKEQYNDPSGSLRAAFRFHRCASRNSMNLPAFRAKQAPSARSSRSASVGRRSSQPPRLLPSLRKEERTAARSEAHEDPPRPRSHLAAPRPHLASSSPIASVHPLTRRRSNLNRSESSAT